MNPELILFHLKQHVPFCPGLYRAEVVERLAGRDVPAFLARQHVLDMLRSVIRHQLTDYDQLRTRYGLTCAEAQAAVAQEIADYIAQWQSPR
jgi:hypothetical protein